MLKIEPDKQFIKETKAIALMQKTDMGGISPLSDRLERLVSIIEEFEQENQKLRAALLDAASIISVNIDKVGMDFHDNVFKVDELVSELRAIAQGGEKTLNQRKNRTSRQVYQ